MTIAARDLSRPINPIQTSVRPVTRPIHRLLLPIPLVTPVTMGPMAPYPRRSRSSWEVRNMGFLDKVENVAGRAKSRFSNDVEPIEIASKLRETMDKRAASFARDRSVVPNVFRIHLAPSDFQRVVSWSPDETARPLELADVDILESVEEAKGGDKDDEQHVPGPVAEEQRVADDAQDHELHCDDPGGQVSAEAETML